MSEGNMADEEVMTLPERETETNPLLSESEIGKAEVFATTSLTNHTSDTENDEPNPGTSASAGLTNGHRNSLSSKSRTTGSPSDEPVDEDQVDECSHLNSPDDNPMDHNAAIHGQPKGGEYAKMMELLKEAEAAADPDAECRERKMQYLTKFNPRGGPETRLSLVDYCCNIFQCCALCIEG